MEQWKKELLKLTKSGRNDLLQVITLFLEGKFEQLDIKPLKWTDLMRCRLGQLRIIFRKRGKEILIIKIGNRGDIYKPL